jgi:putative RecB family exonuclease
MEPERRYERPEGLFISVSQLKTYLKCPRQYELRYVRGVAPAFVPVPLAFGIAFHRALAAFYGGLKETGSPPELGLLLTVFEDAWKAATNGPVPLQPGDEEDETVDHLGKGIEMLKVFHAHAFQQENVIVEAVEMPFTVDLHEPDTGEVLEERLTGVLDLVLGEDEHRVIVEHKSSAKKYSLDQLRYDIQPSAYGFAAKELGWGEIGLRFSITTKTKSPAMQVEDILRDAGDEDDFLRTVTGVLRSIDAGAFFPIRGWQCRSCQFQAACRPSR